MLPWLPELPDLPESSAASASAAEGGSSAAFIIINIATTGAKRVASHERGQRG